MQNPYITNNSQSKIDETINKAVSNMPFLPENFNYSSFLKGAIIGVGVAYLMTNEKAQQTLFRAIIKGGDLLNASMAELKERFEDAKAQLEDEK
ncbi:MAG: YtxH domain-containing protein [Campylobacter sp.]|nr:YtxH domain-containing protein [Campylobacter sp.]